MNDIQKCQKYLQISQYEQIFAMRAIQESQQLLNYYYNSIMEVCKQKHKMQQLKHTLDEVIRQFTKFSAQRNLQEVVNSFIYLRQTINNIIKAEFRVFMCCQKPISILGNSYFDQVYFFKQLIGFDVVNLTQAQIRCLLTALNLQELQEGVTEIQLQQIQLYFEPSNRLIKKIVERLNSHEKYINYDQFKQVIQENENTIFILQNKLQEAQQRKCSILIVPTDPNQPFQEYRNTPSELCNNQSVKFQMMSGNNSQMGSAQSQLISRVQNSEYVIIDPTFQGVKNNTHEITHHQIQRQAPTSIYFQQKNSTSQIPQNPFPGKPTRQVAEKSLSDISDIEYSSKISNIYLSDDEPSQNNGRQLRHKNLEESLASDIELRKQQKQQVTINTEFLQQKNTENHYIDEKVTQQQQLSTQQIQKLQKQLQKLNIQSDPFILKYLVEKSQEDFVNGYVTPRVKHDMTFYGVNLETGEIKQETDDKNINYQLTSENQEALVEKINKICQLKEKHETLETKLKSLTSEFTNEQQNKLKVHKQITEVVAEMLDNYDKFHELTKFPCDYQFKTANIQDQILNFLPDNYIEQLVISSIGTKKIKNKDKESISQLRQLSKQQQLGFIFNQPAKDQKFTKQQRQIEQSFSKYQKQIQKSAQKQKIGKLSQYKSKNNYEQLQSQFQKQQLIDQKAKQLGLSKVSSLPFTSQGQQYYKLKNRAQVQQLDDQSSQSKPIQEEEYNIGRLESDQLYIDKEQEELYQDKDNINSVVRISTHRPTSMLQYGLRTEVNNQIESFEMDKKTLRNNSDQTTDTPTENKNDTYIVDLDQQIVDSQRLENVINSFNILQNTLKTVEETDENLMFNQPLLFSVASQENELFHKFNYRIDDEKNDRKFMTAGEQYSNKCRPSLELEEDILNTDLKVWIQSAVYDSNSPYRLFDSTVFNIKSIDELERKRNLQLLPDIKKKSCICCKKTNIM